MLKDDLPRCRRQRSRPPASSSAIASRTRWGCLRSRTIARTGRTHGAAPRRQPRWPTTGRMPAASLPRRSPAASRARCRRRQSPARSSGQRSLQHRARLDEQVEPFLGLEASDAPTTRFDRASARVRRVPWLRVERIAAKGAVVDSVRGPCARDPAHAAAQQLRADLARHGDGAWGTRAASACRARSTPPLAPGCGPSSRGRRQRIRRSDAARGAARAGRSCGRARGRCRFSRSRITGQLRPDSRPSNECRARLIST